MHAVELQHNIPCEGITLRRFTYLGKQTELRLLKDCGILAGEFAAIAGLFLRTYCGLARQAWPPTKSQKGAALAMSTAPLLLPIRLICRIKRNQT